MAAEEISLSSESAAAPAKFRIDSETRANWLLRKLADLDAEEARIKTQAKQRLAEIKADRESLSFVFLSQLMAWAQAELKGKDRKTLTLLQGTCAFRWVSKGFAVKDADALLAHAKTEGLTDLIEVKESISVEAAKSYAEQTGEVLPGMEIVPAHDAFSVRFPKLKEPTGEQA